jgi:hypothetical protein
MPTLLRLLPLATLLAAGPIVAEPLPQFDIAVTGVAITAAPAGQPSQALVTIANHGTQTLYPSDYEIEIRTPSGSRRRSSCLPDSPPLDVTDYPEQIGPGQSEVVTVRHVFLQAGSLEVTVRAALDYDEDGARDDDAMTITRAIPAPRCAR